MGELPHHHENQQRLERLRSFIQEPESFQEVANLCRLLSDNSRVRIFWLLCHCEECVMNLSAPARWASSISTPNNFPIINAHRRAAALPGGLFPEKLPRNFSQDNCHGACFSYQLSGIIG